MASHHQRARPGHAIEWERIIVRTSNTLRLASLVGALVVAVAPAPAVALQAVTTVSPVALVDSARTATVDETHLAPRTAWSGVFRVQLSLGSREAGAPAAIVIERVLAGPSGFMVVDSRTVSLSEIRVEGDLLRARVTTGDGVGTLMLRVSGDAVSGTLKVGKQTWDVIGQRSA
jgi:hypothetical protein